jgi:hypothetical protein
LTGFQIVREPIAQVAQSAQPLADTADEPVMVPLAPTAPNKFFPAWSGAQKLASTAELLALYSK